MKMLDVYIKDIPHNELLYVIIPESTMIDGKYALSLLARGFHI